MAEAEVYSAGSPIGLNRYDYVPTYGALNRMTSADYWSWNGTSFVVTARYDVAGITYDAAGNLTALQRRNELGTVIDQLSYAYPAGSNRLSAVTDAWGGNAETWDAETGSFTYDPNGNMLTGPAPYAMSAVTYDHQNLPLSLTSNGTTTVYRYTEAGQRIAKQVGTGNREMYVQDGPVNLGVVTVNSSNAVVSWFFNVVAGNQVVGRQPSSGDRRFYHTDLLGSTRAVTDSATILESYDYDPWGVLMPGRTLAGATKEGFTGKERDPETGLDYFGARYEMSALGRWAAVDPLGEKHPEWSSYNYVLDNPAALIDPDGRQVDPNERGCPPCQVSFTGQPPEAGVEQFFRNLILSAASAFAEGMQVVRHSLEFLFPPAAVGTNMAEGDYGEAALVAGTLLVPGGLTDDASRLVIGKLDDLLAPGAIGAGEHSLLPRLAGDLGSPRANWARNAGALRAEIAKGMPIRDASVNLATGALERNTRFLRAERNLLQERGWTYDPATRLWNPPPVRNP